MSRKCCALGCLRAVPPQLFMCRRHWLRLPAALQAAIWKEYVPGQELHGRPSLAYLDQARRCQVWLWNSETGEECQTIQEAQASLRRHVASAGRAASERDLFGEVEGGGE
jgi:hypothetical protein